MAKTPGNIKVCVVLDPKSRGWIIEKFALRLVENLSNWQVQAEIVDQPSPDADINHYMIYHHCRGERITKGTMWITHVDDYEKMMMVKRSLEIVDLGICLSRMTVNDLVEQGIPRQSLCAITPVHDGLMQPRRIVIGITTNVYDDHRKRENLLLDLANTMRLDAFHFEIMGWNWDKIIPHLKAAGASVRWYPGSDDFMADYKVNLERIPNCDYYLYTGLDEGSLGTLDALAAGVATILTPQGFHLDLENGITHEFWDATQLRDVFKEIQSKRRQRIMNVANLTWPEYARQHSIVWKALLENRQPEIEDLLHPERKSYVDSPQLPLKVHIKSKISFYSKPIIRRLVQFVNRKS